MVVRDLDPCRSFPRPYKTNPELIVDPDRVLTGAVRAYWSKFIRGHYYLPSMVVRNSNIVCFAIDPSEDYPPLIVDADRVKILQVAF